MKVVTLFCFVSGGQQQPGEGK